MTDATKASEVAERLMSWVHLLGPIQEAKGLTLNAASGLSATVHIDGDRNAVVPRLLNDIRVAEAIIRAQSERERVLVEALGRVELRFDAAEIERLKQRAICGPRSSVVGSGVVLSPIGNVLCTCHQQSDAELIAKLWNGARK